MGRLSVYQHKDYKKFVLEWIQRAPNEGRGQRRLLAEAISCQTPFITHVLAGDYHFSAEQAESCARWMGLNEEDTEYFVLMVLKQRSGTRGLEALFSKQLAQRRQVATVLKKRLNIKESMSPESQATYYSSWHFSAVHIAMTIPSCTTLAALERTLHLSRIRILEVINFLAENGLIEETKAGYRVLRKVFHLDKMSPLLPQYLVNWRLRAAEAVQVKSDTNLHYSGMTSISTEDFDWVRERLSSALEEIATKIRDSGDEHAAVINLDWFELS